MRTYPNLCVQQPTLVFQMHVNITSVSHLLIVHMTLTPDVCCVKCGKMFKMHLSFLLLLFTNFTAFLGINKNVSIQNLKIQRQWSISQSYFNSHTFFICFVFTSTTRIYHKLEKNIKYNLYVSFIQQPVTF
jgi:hypothetical protein